MNSNDKSHTCFSTVSLKMGPDCLPVNHAVNDTVPAGP